MDDRGNVHNQGPVQGQNIGINQTINQTFIHEDSQNVQEKRRRNKYRQQIKCIENAIIRRYYSEAYQNVIGLLKEVYTEMSTQEQAKLKYLEALVHLGGKRPSVQVPSVMKRVEELLYGASSLHNLFAYKKILAVLKLDFARTGIQTKKQKQDANKLSHQADRLQMKSEDREILSIFSRSLPQLSLDYSHQLPK